MNSNLIVFNIAFYLLNFLLYALAIRDQSASLGIVVVALIYWLVSLVLLVLLIKYRAIVVRSIWDRIGVVTATPILLILVVVLIRTGIIINP